MKKFLCNTKINNLESFTFRIQGSDALHGNLWVLSLRNQKHMVSLSPLRSEAFLALDVKLPVPTLREQMVEILSQQALDSIKHYLDQAKFDIGAMIIKNEKAI